MGKKRIYEKYKGKKRIRGFGHPMSEDILQGLLNRYVRIAYHATPSMEIQESITSSTGGMANRNHKENERNNWNKNQLNEICFSSNAFRL